MGKKRKKPGIIHPPFVRRLRPSVMTRDTWEALAFAWGKPPRCYVCGQPLRVGDRWRWLIPQGGGEWLPLFGCAERHDGQVIEAWGKLFRIPAEKAEAVTKTA